MSEDFFKVKGEDSVKWSGIRGREYLENKSKENKIKLLPRSIRVGA